MREHLGEEFGGVVSAVTSFGIFVTLDAMYVEGLVHITELGGEYYRFDEARQELRGERTGMRFALGTRVRVQVSRVDLDGRRIDFRLMPDSDALLARPAKEHEPGRENIDRKGAGDSANGGRRSRKLAEPLPATPRVPRSALPKKSGASKAVEPAKVKVRKPRRRS
jgi:ribonuclease R